MRGIFPRFCFFGIRWLRRLVAFLIALADPLQCSAYSSRDMAMKFFMSVVHWLKSPTKYEFEDELEYLFGKNKGSTADPLED
jgi:hypothetical protein